MEVNMNLLIWSIIVSFVNVFSLKCIQGLLSWLLDTNKEDRKILTEIALLKKEQSEIFIVREYVKHTKLQRKINKLNEQFKTRIKENATKNLKIKFTCNVSFYIFSIIFNLLFIYYNYYQSVMCKLPSNWLSPASWLGKWPLSEDGTMSFLFWYSITNCVAKIVFNNVLEKKCVLDVS